MKQKDFLQTPLFVPASASFLASLATFVHRILSFVASQDKGAEEALVKISDQSHLIIDRIQTSINSAIKEMEQLSAAVLHSPF